MEIPFYGKFGALKVFNSYSRITIVPKVVNFRSFKFAFDPADPSTGVVFSFLGVIPKD